MLIFGVDPGSLAVGLQCLAAQIQEIISLPALYTLHCSIFQLPISVSSSPEIGLTRIQPWARLGRFPVLSCLCLIRQSEAGISQAVLQGSISQWLLLAADAGETLLAGKKSMAAAVLSLLHLGEGEIGYGQVVLACCIPQRMAIPVITSQSLPVGCNSPAAAFDLVGGIACCLGQYKIGSGQIGLGGSIIKRLVLGAVDAQGSQSRLYRQLAIIPAALQLCQLSIGSAQLILQAGIVLRKRGRAKEVQRLHPAGYGLSQAALPLSEIGQAGIDRSEPPQNSGPDSWMAVCSIELQCLFISIHRPGADLRISFALYDLQTAISDAPQKIALLQNIHLQSQHPLPYPESSLVFCKIAVWHSLHRLIMNSMELSHHD